MVQAVGAVILLYMAGAVTCMPDVLDPDIGAGGEEEPVDRYEERWRVLLPVCQTYWTQT